MLIWGEMIVYVMRSRELFGKKGGEMIYIPPLNIYMFGSSTVRIRSFVPICLLYSPIYCFKCSRPHDIIEECTNLELIRKKQCTNKLKSYENQSNFDSIISSRGGETISNLAT